MEHDWVSSTLGHGETMCSRCCITNREAAVLGLTNYCDTPPKDLPSVTIHPDVQAKIDTDPSLASFVRQFSEDALNAMQAVKDGRHPDFDTAMKALGYDPEPIDMGDDGDDE